METKAVMVEGEGGSEMRLMTPADIKRVKVLLKQYELTGDWANEINKIIRRSKVVKIAGTIATYGDGGGWYGPER